MTICCITVTGRASAQVIADRALLNFDLTASGKTIDAAKSLLLAKALQIESAFPGGSGIEETSVDTTPDDAKDFVVLDSLSHPGPNDLFTEEWELPIRQADDDTDSTTAALPKPSRLLEEVTSWRKSEVSISVNHGYWQTKAGSRKGKKGKKCPNTSNTIPGFDDASMPISQCFPPPLMDPLVAGIPNENTAANSDLAVNVNAVLTYWLTLGDINALGALQAELRALGCILRSTLLYLLPETKRSLKAELCQSAAKDGLMQVHDYCSGLSCDPTTTRITPVDIVTAAGLRRDSRLRSRTTTDYPYGRDSLNLFGAEPASETDPELESFDVDKRLLDGNETNKIEYRHELEMKFQIETRGLTLSEINRTLTMNNVNLARVDCNVSA